MGVVNWHRSFLAGLLLLAAGGLAYADSAPRPPPSLAPDGTWVTPFHAMPLDGDTPIFTGEYVVERKDGLLREIQRYRDPQGRVVHRVESLYDEINRRPVFYESDDFTNGVAHVVQVRESGVDFEIRDAQGRVTRSGHQDKSEGVYLWPNLAQLVDANWDNVVTGKDLDVELFFASLSTSVSVQVAKDGKAEVNGITGEQFKVVPSSILVRLFVKPIRLVFSTDGTHRLLTYEGRSVVLDGNRKNMDLRIVFGARKAG